MIAPEPHNLALWLHGEISESSGRLLGTGYQASVHLYASPVGEVVVKQPHRSLLLGAVWRRLIRREHRVYTRLDGIVGVPRCHGLIDGEYLALEYVPGPSLREHEPALQDRDAFFTKLLSTLQAMHAAGVAHGDLKRKDNVVVAAGEQPYVIDFGIACLRSASGGALNRLVFDTVKQMDYNAWIKLKYQRRVDELSAADAHYYRPLLIERIARTLRIVWQRVSLRRPRQRWRRRNRND
ncbi:MAG TPA: phosphotransferase [Gammaproteobacteria bacterium]|nr:phosphotransferase [Gammaproteobacteria bacterium]